MPVHDWAKVDAGLFHHFHQAWSAELCRALNRGVLPSGYSALIEGKAQGVEPDVLTLASRHDTSGSDSEGGLLVATTPPKARHVSRPAGDAESYAARANRLTVRHRLGRVVAIIEIVSPGNKDRRGSVTAFVSKATDLLARGVNLLIIDILPPTPRDPAGMYKLIWDEVREEPFELPPEAPLVLASCVGEPLPTAYVESIGVGQVLPEMPLFLDRDRYVRVPLEATYNLTWEDFPTDYKPLVLNPGALPSSED
jgi:hypothetical protein